MGLRDCAQAASAIRAARARVANPVQADLENSEVRRRSRLYSAMFGVPLGVLSTHRARDWVLGDELDRPAPGMYGSVVDHGHRRVRERRTNGA